MVEFKSDGTVWCGAYLDSRCQEFNHWRTKGVEFRRPVENESPYCKAFLELDMWLETSLFRKRCAEYIKIIATSWISESIDLDVMCLEMTSVLRAAVRNRLDIRGRKGMSRAWSTRN